MNPPIIFLQSRRLLLRPLQEQDFNCRYLSWLNDPVVNAFSQRRPFPCSLQQMRSYSEYYEKNYEKGFVLAIIMAETDEHIGNISLLDIHFINRTADIAILIGERDYWNKGIGGEAIYLLSRHGFEAMNLNKLIAGTFNPAFSECVKKIGWKVEGVFRQRIWSNNTYRDQIWLSQLRSEFQILDRFEKTEGID
ncbi:N-acetyltransferase [Candidatus Parcubacteria bacterium]|nr:MAG: N-acetyltransferase [Candidatus Parcubacteria bacterium]